MAIAPELLEFLTETIALAPYVGQSDSGVPVYGDDVEYAARVSLRNELVRSHDGRELASRGKVYVAMTTVPDVRSRLTLPANYQPRVMPMLDVQPENDETATLNHVVLVLG